MQGYLTEMTNRKNFLLILLDKEMGQAYIPDEITLELIAEIWTVAYVMEWSYYGTYH